MFTKKVVFSQYQNFIDDINFWLMLQHFC